MHFPWQAQYKRLFLSEIDRWRETEREREIDKHTDR